MEKYGKTPNFSDRQHFYSYFQNPSENSALMSLFGSNIDQSKEYIYSFTWLLI